MSNNNNIVFIPDDEQAYCDPPCDALLIERADETKICSVCAKVYEVNTVQKHHNKLTPEAGYDSMIEKGNGSPIENITHYTDMMGGKKKVEVTAFEDEALKRKKSGFTIVDSEEILP